MTRRVEAVVIALALSTGLASTAAPLPAPPAPAQGAPFGGFIAVCVNGNPWLDGGFEETDPVTLLNPHYEVFDNIFPSSLCNLANSLCTDGEGPRTGQSWAWFGGNDIYIPDHDHHVDWAEQALTFPSGVSSATLNFYLRIGLVTAPFTDTLEVQVDGVTQQTYVEPSKAETSYTLRSIDLTAFADGAEHTVKFLYTQGMSTTMNRADFNADDVSLDIVCAPVTLTPVALKVDPVASGGNGVLEPNELTPVTVAPTWRNDGIVSVDPTGATSNFTGPGGLTYANPDAVAYYGTIGVGAFQQCTDCYTMKITAATRPSTHWDATVDETVTPTSTVKTWTLHVGNSFTDVSTDIAVNPYYPSIETIFHKGVTAGCHTGTDFCPTDPSLRSEMAVFLLKAFLGGAYTPPACAGIFSDVLCPSTPAFPYSDWIEDIYGRGITAGCQAQGDPLAYCPGNNVLRQEMAVFLLKTSLGSGYTPPACATIFSDVPCPATPQFPYSNFIEDLYNRGVTSGCQAPGDPLAYCPGANVPRQQMAVLLTRTFGLVLYGP